MTEEYIYMTTPLGLLPLNSTSMRALVDKINEQAEKITMMEAQLLIRKDRIKSLTSGPGGIMEMKQTIADKEIINERLGAEVERLRPYESLVRFIANDYLELSYDKAQWQRDDWCKRCMRVIEND